MRFVYYDDLDSGEREQLGIEVFGVIYNLPAMIEQVATRGKVAAPRVPHTIWDYHAFTPEEKGQLQALVDKLSFLEPEQRGQLMRHRVRRLPPVPHPSSLRCFSAFEGYTKITRQRRGLAMPTEWYEMPVFFFGNHNALFGHGDEVPQPASFWLDYEFQIACVVGQEGINIRAEDADPYIAGYTILNDWCARDLEMYEIRMGLAPTKGRDFAVSMGPTLVTPDELTGYAIGEGAQRRYDLRMSASVNDRDAGGLHIGGFRDIYFTFAQMVERASADAMLYPGDILASGAVDGGSLLSIGAEETLGRWLATGDVVDLEVEGLGVLRNTIAPPWL